MNVSNNATNQSAKSKGDFDKDGGKRTTTPAGIIN